MNKKSYLYLLIAFGFTSCGNGIHSEHNQADEHISEVKAGDVHEHSEEIVLDKHIANEFGVKVVEISPTHFNNVIKTAGKILPSSEDDVILSAKSAGIITFKNNLNLGSHVNKGTVVATISARGVSGGDENESAASTLEFTKKELERLKPLYEEQIIPEKDYLAAQNAYEQAFIAYSGSKQGSVVSSKSAGIITNLFVKSGEYVTAGQPIARVSSSKKLVLKADLPEKYVSGAHNIISANIRMPYQNLAISLAELNGKITTTPEDNYQVSPGYIPIYFEFENDGSITAGSSCEVFLLGKMKSDVIVIPEDAIIEQMGQKYVFIKIDDDGYKKVPVELGASDGVFQEVISGINQGDSLVVEGVTFIKLAENKNVIPQGHTHNH